MPKFRINVGSFVTRYNERNITVSAPDAESAEEKAIEKYIKTEYKLACSSDSGTPEVNDIEEI